MGGSATNMASQIAEGYILVSPATIRGYSPADLLSLRVELEKLQRDSRAVVPPPDDAVASQTRNRRISRINSAIQTVNHKIAVKP
jgi:hypothetical protein